MNQARYLNRPHNDAFASLTHARENLGRVLLVLTAIELISMPFTQYAWTWDHFLHGGMDFESSLLFLVVCLGFLIVLRHHCRQGEIMHVPRWRLSLSTFDADQSAAMLGTGALFAFHRERGASSELATYNLPLQI